MNSIRKRLNKNFYFKKASEALKVIRYSINAKYYCPVCNRKINRFLPLHKFYSNNAKKYGYPYSGRAETLNYQSYSCPICRAADRDRLYALYVQNYFTSIKKDKQISIIDIAPSAPLSGYIRKIISESKHSVSYRTADIAKEDVDDKIDITDMPCYDNNQFDFFICSHVLEHVYDDNRALSELYRILKPGGSGILMVPICLAIEKIDEDPSITDEAERWRRFGQNDHVRLYSKNGFIERVGKAGFVLHQYGKEYFGGKTFMECGITDQSV
jgi:SAM-dependent methyltransferase